MEGDSSSFPARPQRSTGERLTNYMWRLGREISGDISGFSSQIHQELVEKKAFTDFDSAQSGRINVERLEKALTEQVEAGNVSRIEIWLPRAMEMKSWRGSAKSNVWEELRPEIKGSVSRLIQERMRFEQIEAEKRIKTLRNLQELMSRGLTAQGLIPILVEDELSNQKFQDDTSETAGQNNTRRLEERLKELILSKNAPRIQELTAKAIQVKPWIGASRTIWDTLSEATRTSILQLLKEHNEQNLHRAQTVLTTLSSFNSSTSSSSSVLSSSSSSTSSTAALLAAVSAASSPSTSFDRLSASASMSPAPVPVSTSSSSSPPRAAIEQPPAQ